MLKSKIKTPLTIETILEHPSIWTGKEISKIPQKTLDSGFEILDKKLGGWHFGTINEIIVQHQGIGEFSLLLPAIAEVSKTDSWVVLINPPYIPYAPCLLFNKIDLKKILVVNVSRYHDLLWTMEQVLRAENCSIAITWTCEMNNPIFRRLQLAAKSGNSIGFYFNNIFSKRSPAPYRFYINAYKQTTNVKIIKYRGNNTLQSFKIR